MSQAVEEAPIEVTKPKDRVKYWQVDALKAFAIALVVLDHSLTWELKSLVGGVFWERTAIPIFMIIMGFNIGLSFKHRGFTTLRELYSWSYWKSKIERYVLPFLLLYLGSLLLGVYFNSITFNEYSLIGWLPFWGPGNWFVPVLFSSILVLPLIYRGYISYPKLTVFLCFMSEILLQLFMFYNVPLVPVDGFWQFQSYEAAFLSTLIRTNVLFLLPAVGLGLWFADGPEITAKRNRLMAVAVPASIVYMFAYQVLGFRAEIIDGIYKYKLIWGDYTFLVIPYSALIFLLAMKYLPSTPSTRLQKIIQRVGRASYHILLVQIFYYSIWYFSNPNWANVGFGSNYLFHIWFYVVSLVLTFVVGIVWYEAERKAYRRNRSYWNHTYVRRAVYATGAFMSIAVLGMAIEFVSEITGLREWQRTHGPFFVLDRPTGPGVIANIIVIIIMLSICLFFIYKTFTTMDEEIPIEVIEGTAMV
ncbi:MAG: acyltransferase family protein [Candidatus Thorarchaeota archaeon]